MLRRVSGRTAGNGVLSFPCAPALIDHFVEQLGKTFAIYGRPFSEADLAKLREIVLRKAKEGFAISPHSRLEVGFQTQEPPGDALDYQVRIVEVTTAQRYEFWVATRKPPLFGAHADGKALAVARSLGDPKELTALDIGAGTGRNAIGFAELGMTVDALEPVTALVTGLRASVAERGLAVNVIEGNMFDEGLPLRPEGYSLVFLAEVIASHCRGLAELERMVRRSCELTRPGGVLLFNLFLTMDGYKPDDLARELSEVVWSVAFTRKELTTILDQLPLDLVRDESAFEVEKAASAPDAWPPTGWFPEWSQGQDLFDLPSGKSPLELRWIECRRRG
jgi:SAM-dependent methyltransferase